MRPDRHNRPPWLLDKRLKRIYLYVKESWVAKCGSVCAHRGNTGPLCLISFIHCVSLASPPPVFPLFLYKFGWRWGEASEDRFLFDPQPPPNPLISWEGQPCPHTMKVWTTMREQKKKSRGLLRREGGGGLSFLYTTTACVEPLFFSILFSILFSVQCERCVMVASRFINSFQKLWWLSQPVGSLSFFVFFIGVLSRRQQPDLSLNSRVK